MQKGHATCAERARHLCRKGDQKEQTRQARPTAPSCPARVHASVQACMHGCVRACVRASLRAHACVSACVRECVRACVHVWACLHPFKGIGLDDAARDCSHVSAIGQSNGCQSPRMPGCKCTRDCTHIQEDMQAGLRSDFVRHVELLLFFSVADARDRQRCRTGTCARARARARARSTGGTIHRTRLMR